MEPPENETPAHQVSTIIDKEAGHATEDHSMLPPGNREQAERETFDQELEEYLNHLNVPTVHCSIDRNTGVRTSMSTTGHSYGGGFADTKRQSVKPDSEMDGTSLFDSSAVIPLPHGIEHVFSVVRRYPSANLGDGREGTTFMADDFVENLNAMDVNSGHQLTSDADAVPHLPVVAQVQKRNPRKKQPRNGEREPKLSEVQLFANAIRLHTRRTAFLSHVSDSNSYIRSHHIVTKNRTLAFVSAVFSSERTSNPSAVLTVLWETKKKPHYAVVINLTVPEGGNDILANCSCDYLITEKKGSDPSCFHAQVILADEVFVGQVTREIRRRKEVPNLNPRTCLFGSPIELSSITELSPYLNTF